MKRNKKPVEPQEHNIWPGGTFALVITAVIVVLIMIIAWALPEASDAARNRDALTATPVPVQIEQGTGEPLSTAESVGYGDGIIVFSAGLIVLVLGLVLRELLLHRKQVLAMKTTEPAVVEEKEKDEPAG